MLDGVSGFDVFAFAIIALLLTSVGDKLKRIITLLEITNDELVFLNEDKRRRERESRY